MAGAITLLAAAVIGVSVAASPGRAALAAFVIVAVGAAVTSGTATRARRLNVNEVSRGAKRGIFGWLACATLLLGIFTVSWNGVRAAPGLTLSDPLLLGALGCWALARRGVAQELVRVPVWILAGAYLLALAVGMSEIVGTGAVKDAFPGLRLLVVMCLVPALIGTVSGGTNLTVAVALSWVAGVAVNGTVGVLDSSFGSSIGTSLTGVESVDRASGLTTQANHLAVASAMALPFAVSLFLSLRGPVLKGLTGISMAMIVLGCLASGSRAGLAGLACTVLFVAWTQRRQFLRTVRIMVIGLTLIIVLLSTLPGGNGTIAIDRALGRGAAEVGVVQSDRTRTLYRDQAIERFSSSPLFGTGFGEFRRAHSVYLQLLAAGGLCALLGFLIFLSGAIITGVSLSRDPLIVQPLAGLAGASAVALFAWGVMGLLSNQIFDRYLFVPVGLLWSIWVLRRGDAQPARDGDVRTSGAPLLAPTTDMR